MTREVKNGKVALKGGQCGRMEKMKKMIDIDSH